MYSVLAHIHVAQYTCLMIVQTLSLTNIVTCTCIVFNSTDCISICVPSLHNTQIWGSNLKTVASKLKTLAPLLFATLHQCTIGSHAHHAIIGKTWTPCYHWEDMHTMLSLGRHAHHAIIGKTCTPCYHWKDMHTMLSLERHAHHAIIGKTCTPCYHWEDMHTMLSLGRHAHHAIIGKTWTPCYHWY